MFKNLKSSLTTRIVVNILTFCVLLFVVCLGTFYIFSKHTIERKTIDNAIEVSHNAVFRAEHVLRSTETIIDNFMWKLHDIENLSPEKVIQVTKTITESNPFILGCAVAFEPWFFPEQGKYFSPYTMRKNGETELMLLGDEEYEYFVMDWFQTPKFIGHAFWSEPYFDEGGSDAIITSYSRPFFNTDENGNKEFIGVITIDLSLEWFTKIISDIKILETGYSTVITQHGTFVINPNEELIMHETIFSFAKEIDKPKLRDIGRDMLAGNNAFAECNIRGTNMQLYYTPLPSNKWTLITVFPEDEMYASLQNISIILLLLTITGLALMITIVYRVVKKQISPLKVFAESARDIALGNFHTDLPEIKTEDEMRYLSDSFSYMQKELTTYIENLKDTTAAKEKIESELRIAREIQMGMIPKIFPPFPDVPEIDLYAMLEPAKEVGGDLYDFFLIDDQHLCFAIGDVSGKGVPASLFMAVTRTLLRSTAPNEHSSAKIVNTLNRSLSSGNDSSMFVTFFLGIINLKSGEMIYTNAGHNPPVILHKGEAPRYFETTDQIPIGLFDDFQYKESAITLKPSDVLFLYTDGITEAENKDKKLYSDPRLLSQLSMPGKRLPKTLIDHIYHDIAKHVDGNEQSDDITMLSLIFFGRQQ